MPTRNQYLVVRALTEKASQRRQYLSLIIKGSKSVHRKEKWAGVEPSGQSRASVFQEWPVARATGSGEMRLHEHLEIKLQGGLGLVLEREKGEESTMAPDGLMAWGDSRQTPCRALLPTVWPRGWQHCITRELFRDADPQVPLAPRAACTHHPPSYAPLQTPRGQGPVVSTDRSLERPLISGITKSFWKPRLASPLLCVLISRSFSFPTEANQ